MREILAARSDRDFVSTARRRSSTPTMSSGRRLLIAALQRPGLILGGLTMATAATAIVVNALGFQSARHPAPIFAKSERVPPHRSNEAVGSALPPVPPTRPVSVNATAALPAARPSARDPIADIIRSADPPVGGAPAARLEEARLEAQRHVAAAQRALSKLNYGPLKIDGVMGQETRQAIERFERERRLPVTGDLGSRTIRELSSQSGIRVE